MPFFLKIGAVTSIPQSQPAEMEQRGFSKPLKCCLLQVVYSTLRNRKTDINPKFHMPFQTTSG